MLKAKTLYFSVDPALFSKLQQKVHELAKRDQVLNGWFKKNDTKSVSHITDSSAEGGNGRANLSLTTIYYRDPEKPYQEQD